MAFKPAFIDGPGMRYLQWGDILTSKQNKIRFDKLMAFIKRIMSRIKPAITYGKEKWLMHGWPVVRD
jgi:hypothetical protein